MKYYHVSQGTHSKEGNWMEPTHPMTAESLELDVERGLACRVCEIEADGRPGWGSGYFGVQDDGEVFSLITNFDSSD